MTVETKHGHVDWFRDYFKKRGDEIEQLHALDIKHQQALEEIQGGNESTTTATTTASN